MTTDTLSDRPRPGRKGLMWLIAPGAAAVAPTTTGISMAEILTCAWRSVAR